ncbi:MAG: hypothetical protein A2Y34_08080 [Spirochaetes bacterium GWC1_27_15]|nr:MAG: hypothetical protein A2Y34_08080 [Spirochaetes bacterium GWC1_27_15]
MGIVYFWGKNKHIENDLKNMISDKYSFLKSENYSDMEEASLLVVDLTEFDKTNWKTFWPSTLPFPKSLSINNIKVVAITNKCMSDFAMDLLENDFSDFIQYPFDLPRVLGTLANTVRDIEYEKEISSLYQIGIELSSEPDLEKLLQEILSTSMDFTNSDGGSIYLVIPEKDSETKEKMMQFECSASDTLGNRYKKIKMPISHRSLAGYVISTGKNLNIQDAYNLPKDIPYQFDSSFDKKNNYKSKTMLVVPMVNHKKEIIGAIQLINKKKNRKIKLTNPELVEQHVVDYDHRNELLIRSMGSQATIAIETAQLYKELHDLFESFMEASVMAVESRDPTTAGHSRRVSKFSVAIANHINLETEGELGKYNFSVTDLQSIKYAGLLHDFGKIGVNEKILLKAKKLFSEELSNIEIRMELLKYTFHNNKKVTEISSIITEVEELKEAIQTANEPGIISKEVLLKLDKASQSEIICLDSKRQPVLYENEYQRLVFSRGTLSKEEYEIMKSHVEHTYKFLSLIKWPKGLEKVPLIARYHHEKLDGSGYPLGIKGNDIPIESQIMCIADIFDALISSDRPYKSRMSLEKAIGILEDEADTGKINKDILDLILQNEIYKLIIEEDR